MELGTYIILLMVIAKRMEEWVLGAGLVHSTQAPDLQKKKKKFCILYGFDFEKIFEFDKFDPAQSV